MHAAVAQSVERRLGKAEVGGSIPLGSLKKSLDFQGIFLLPGMEGCSIWAEFWGFDYYLTTIWLLRCLEYFFVFLLYTE